MKQKLFAWVLAAVLFCLSVRPALAETREEFLHLGNVSGRQEKNAQAIDYYTKAIQEDPGYSHAYYNRGYVYIKMRKYKLAIADLGKAIELDPNYAAAYHVRGIAYNYKKKYKQAILDYSKAIQLEPKNVRFYISRMSAYFKLNDYDHVWKDVIKIQGLGGTVNPSILNMIKDKKYRD